MNFQYISFLLLISVFVYSNALDNERSFPEVESSFEKCDSKKEKKIDIHDSIAKYDDQLKPFKFINFDKEIGWSFSNKDLPTLVPSVASNYSLYVNGSNFNETYQLWKLNFITHQNDVQTSKHFIDNTTYPLELRLVNFVEQSKSFVVLGFFFKQVEQDNEALKDLLDAIVSKNSSEFQFKLSSILPSFESLSSYYRYGGKSVNSACQDGISWSLFEETIPISAKQLKVFSSTQSLKTQRNVENVKIDQLFSSRKERKEVKSDHVDTKVGGKNSLHNSAEFINVSFFSLISALIFKLFL